MLMSPLLSITHGEVKGLELSVKAPDRGAEGPERKWKLWKVDRISHCKVNPIMRNPEALPDSFCCLGTVFIATARNHVRSSETKRINAHPFFFF